MCAYCSKFINKDDFLKHLSLCYKVREEGTQIKMPFKGETIEFKNHRNKIVRPFVFLQIWNVH